MPNTPAFILLRGLTREYRHWGHCLEELKQGFPGSDFLSVDLPGFGIYHQNKSPLHMKDLAQHVYSLSQGFLSQHPKPILLGISLGGMLSLALLAQFPTLFRGAVIINSSAKGLLPFYQRLNLSVVLRYSLAMVFYNAIDREPYVLQVVTNHRPIPQAVLSNWRNIAQTAPFTRANFLRQLLAGMFWRAPTLNPSLPLLFAYSAQDRLVHPRGTLGLHAKLGGKLVCHPSAGHDLTTDDGPWLVNHIKLWCQEQGWHD